MCLELYVWIHGSLVTNVVADVLSIINGKYNHYKCIKRYKMILQRETSTSIHHTIRQNRKYSYKGMCCL